ncbi:MAG: phage tail sheath subtilisin-like domain-containing protein, partial [Symbiobacteriaceae bacterium]|nr:phage tail sheath subtilisin-like domain-containing protein [Symbiobacteriaceae bacterium]
TPSAGVPLTGGANGVINQGTYDGYFKALSFERWQTMGIIDDAPEVPELVSMFVINQIDTQGRKVQGVVYNSVAANHDGIIGLKQGYETESGSIVEPYKAVALAVGVSAGTAMNQSATNMLINGAVAIINELEHEEIEKALLEGWLLFTRRTDGSIKIEQDINTFREFVPTKGKEYRKNRVIRTLGEINNTVKQTWETFYEGKCNNNLADRNSFKGDLIAYFKQLQALNCITNFDPEIDLVVERGLEIDAVVVYAWIQPIDSMEKLYMKVFTDVLERRAAT